MKKNKIDKLSHKSMQLIGLWCLAIQYVNQVNGSINKSLKPGSNYYEKGRINTPNKYESIKDFSIAELLNSSSLDPLDKDLTNRDQAGNPLDFYKNPIKIGERRALASGKSKARIADEQVGKYLEGRQMNKIKIGSDGISFNDRESTKRDRDRRMTDLGIKLEDLFENKNLTQDNEDLLIDFQNRMDNLYGLLRSKHQSVASESDLNNLELDLRDIETSINSKPVNHQPVKVVTANKYSTVGVWRNPLFHAVKDPLRLIRTQKQEALPVEVRP